MSDQKTGRKIDFDLFLQLKSMLDETNIPYRIDLVDFDRADDEFVEKSSQDIYHINDKS